MPSKYLVIQSCGTEDHPKYKGVSFITPCETIDDATKVVARCANEYAEYIGCKLERGDALDCDCEPCIDGDWPDHFYSKDGLSIWVRGLDENWERVEVFEWNERHRHYIRVRF